MEGKKVLIVDDDEDILLIVQTLLSNAGYAVALARNGKDSLEIHADAIASGEKVLIADDVLATGGTAEAAAKLVDRLGGQVVGLTFLIELSQLCGRARLTDRRLHSVLLL